MSPYAGRKNVAKSFEESFDVIVCGGGVAGVAAALEAARAGLRTALLEKTILPGGLATSGLINVYLPLCDGNGRQVTFGIAEELLRLSLRYGPGEVPAWREARGGVECARFQAVFSPASFALALDEALVSAGVEIRFDTLACSPVMDGSRVVGVEAETKAGRGLLRAGCVVDATGDADIAYRAGAPCTEGRNTLAMWALGASQGLPGGATLGGAASGAVRMVRLGKCSQDEADATSCRATDAHGVTEFVLQCRAMLREHYRQAHERGGDSIRQSDFPVALPSMAQFRTTRRVVGQSTIRDGEDGQYRPDSIGLVADWRRAGPVWEIPYGALLPVGIHGLLMAGRCISSDGDAWEVTRVIPPAALTGQVCGVAAALSAGSGAPPGQLKAEEIQRALAGKGIPFHIRDLK